nr:hypothetical protein [Nereida sp. MMG025]
MRRLGLLCLLSLALLGCGQGDAVWAPDELVAQKAYVHNGPSALTLFTVINNRSGSGAHTALMVNGSQRVLFDPAGSFAHETIPERNDVIFGVTPTIKRLYVGAHARITFHVVEQTIDVSPEVAEAALRLVMANGAVPKAACAQSTSAILRQLPGFEGIRPTPFPKNLMNQFADLEGVKTEKFFEDDDGDKGVALANYRPEALAQ